MADERASGTFGHLIFWRYPRGSWQYDILCLLILAFIFLTPRGVFDGSYFHEAGRDAAQMRDLKHDAPDVRAGRVDEKAPSAQP